MPIDSTKTATGSVSNFDSLVFFFNHPREGGGDEKKLPRRNKHFAGKIPREEIDASFAHDRFGEKNQTFFLARTSLLPILNVMSLLPS